MTTFRQVLPILLIAVLPVLLHAEDTSIVRRVVDGDTIGVIFNGKEERICLIEYRHPESHMNPRAQEMPDVSGKDIETSLAQGQKATRFVMTLIKPGDTVIIEFDVHKPDRYGKTSSICLP